MYCFVNADNFYNDLSEFTWGDLLKKVQMILDENSNNKYKIDYGFYVEDINQHSEEIGKRIFIGDHFDSKSWEGQLIILKNF